VRNWCGDITEAIRQKNQVGRAAQLLVNAVTGLMSDYATNQALASQISSSTMHCIPRLQCIVLRYTYPRMIRPMFMKNTER